MALQLSGGSLWFCARCWEDLVCCSTWNSSFEILFIADYRSRFLGLRCAWLERPKLHSRIQLHQPGSRFLLRPPRRQLEQLHLRPPHRPQLCHRELD
jgi:hypothetical protein